MDFIKKSAEFDLISFGEVMLRLSPPDKDKISQSEIFEKNCGGSEFNVASGAANLGIRSAMITLPKGVSAESGTLKLKAEIEVKGVLYPVPVAAANGVNPDGSLNIIRNIKD